MERSLELTASNKSAMENEQGNEKNEHSPNIYFSFADPQSNCKICLRTVTVEPVLLFYMTASFITYPLGQQLLYSKLCLDRYQNNETICNNLTGFKQAEDIIQAEASTWTIYLQIASITPALVLSFYMGSWSDRFGRKLPMVLPCVFTALSAGISIYVCVEISTAPRWLLIVAAFVGSLGGGFTTVLQAVFSYVADITSHGQRSGRVARLESTTFIGALLGSVITSQTLQTNGVPLYVNYVIVAAIMLLVAGYALVRNLQGGPQQEARSPEPLSCGPSVCAELFGPRPVLEMFHAVSRPREGRRRAVILTCIAAMTALVICSSGFRDILFLYVKKRPLSWHSNMLGYFLGAMYSVYALGLAAGLPLARRVWRLSDPALCAIGCVSAAASYTLLAFSTRTWMVFSVIPLGSCSLFAAASLRSILSKTGEPHEQGKLFAVMASFESLSGIVGSAVINSVYTASVSLWAGTSFALLATIVLLVLFLVGWLHRALKDMPSTFDSLINEDDGDKDS